MKPRVVFVNPCSDIGGAEMSLLLLLKGLVDEYELHLILPEQGEVAVRAMEIGVTVHSFPMRPFMIEQNIQRSLKDSLGAITQIPAITKQLSQLKPHLVHINSYRVGVPYTVACKRLNIPSIWHFRDIPSSKIKKNLLAFLAKFPSKSIAISNAVNQVVNTNNNAKVEVIYNGVAMDQFHDIQPGIFRKELNLPSGAVLFCTIGQLIPWKGHDFLIEAFAKLKENPNYYLVIVGGNVSPVWQMPTANRDYAQNLKNLVKSLRVEERVIFTGFRKDIAQILSDIDVYVHSAMAPEPFGRALIEAMAAKKPVVAPNWGGIPEIVENNVTGLLYRPKVLTSITNALETIATMPEKWPLMGEAGYELVNQKFTADLHINNMQRVFKKFIH